MNTSFTTIINYLMHPYKGIIAADDKPESINKRLQHFGIKESFENRTAYREILITTPGIEHYISGIILHEETLEASMSNRLTFFEALHQRGIITGIKVDCGLAPFKEDSIEQITLGGDTLPSRLKMYKKLGAQFCKWRAAFTISDSTPSQKCIDENVALLVAYTKVAVEAGLLPILEPEVLMDGKHAINDCATKTKQVLRSLFEALGKANLDLSQIILKCNMILPGREAKIKASAGEVAQITIDTLCTSVPQQVGAVVFLSGGQSPLEANLNLNAISKIKPVPWPISFSFDRAFMYPVLKAWQGEKANISRAQEELFKEAKNCSLALQGIFKP